MIIITNRNIKASTGLDAFGKLPSAKGPNELRMLDVTKKSDDWSVKAIDDKLDLDTVKELKKKFHLDIDIKKPWHGSLRVACDIYERAKTEGKSILFFVHGYNNDVEDVLKSAKQIEALYNVIVVPFTWPANGGGVISGSLSYTSDKSDARVSSGALNRVVSKIQEFHLMLSTGEKKTLMDKSKAKHPNNPEAAAGLFSALMMKSCPVKINLLCHSMGNYLFKHTLATSENATSKLVFDNICLVAADANTHNHKEWIDKLDVRNRVYVVINENDFALKASRIKPGDEQKARLGHYTKQLNSPIATYLDVTDAKGVGSEHTYFKGEAILNQSLKNMFDGMFNGRVVEESMTYRADKNSYRLSNLAK